MNKMPQEKHEKRLQVIVKSYLAIHLCEHGTPHSTLVILKFVLQYISIL
jgi:hypothetical protein